MKWLGALMLVVSCYLLGIRLSRSEGKKLEALDSLIDMLEYLRRRMIAERAPLYRLFGEFENDFLELSGFLPMMRSCRNGQSRIWCQALDKLPLEYDSKRELLRFGDSLGSLPLEAQLSRLEMCLEALKASREDLRESLPQKQKTTKTTAFLFGALVAIILL